MGKTEGKKKSSTGYYLISAILFIALGVATIMFRGQIEGMLDNIIKWVVAGLFAVAAIVNIIIFAKKPGKSTIVQLIIGILAIVAMIVVMVRADLILWAIGILFGLYLVIEGVVKIVNSFKCKKGGVAAWFLPLIFGILSVLCGLYLIKGTVAISAYFVLMVGIMLVYAGLQNAVNVFVKTK